MNSIEIYKKVLIDIDKYQTPVMEIEEFNRYALRALYEYVNAKYLEYELIQKRTDDLRLFASIPTVIDNTSDNILLPSDYLHILLVSYFIEYPLGTFCKVNKDGWYVVQKTTSDKKGYSVNNYYWKDSISNAKYQIIGNNLYIIVGTDNPKLVKSVKIEYVKTPELVYINPDDINDFTVVSYQDDVIEQVVSIIVRMFRGDTESPLYQVSMSEKQLKKD